MDKTITLLEKDGNIGIMQDGHVIWVDSSTRDELAAGLMTDPIMVKIVNILGEREKTHGDLAVTGHIAADMRNAMRSGPSWPHLPPAAQVAIDEIILKLARLASGRFDEDHLMDIAGYAILALRVASKDGKT